MAWIESHQALGTHRKLFDLSARLRIDELRAVGLLHYLWWWALDNAPDGDLEGIPARTLAKASHWKKDPQVYMTALCDSGFIDNDGTLRLHNWDDYAGKLIQARKRNKEKQQQYRVRNRDITVTKKLRNGATVPNSTQPNSNKEILKKVPSVVSVFELWNEQETFVHKKLTDDMKRAIDTALKEYSQDEVSQAIKNYAEILKDEQYYFKYTWTLKDFLKRGLEKFLNIEIARKNYLSGKGGQSGAYQRKPEENRKTTNDQRRASAQ